MMSGKTSILLLATAFATLPTSSSACEDYVLISTRGTFEQQGPSVGFIGMINTTLNTLPGGIEYDTVYPAIANLTGVPQGVTDIQRYINDGVSSCPQQKYALLGYSQGASVTDIALHNLTQNSAVYNAIKAIVVIGNPGHVSGASANVDENGGATTRNFNGSYYLEGAGAIPDVFYKDDKVLDICYQGDLVCALPPNGTFAILQPHLLYGSTSSVQKQGSDFMIRKLGNGKSATASGSISVSMATKSRSRSVSVCPATATSSARATASTSAQATASSSSTYTGSALISVGLPDLHSIAAALAAFAMAMM